MSEKDQFLCVWEQECATTVKVLRAYPGGKTDLRPHERARTAKELAGTLMSDGVVASQAVAGTLELPPKNIPAPPAQWDDMVTACETAYRGLADSLRKTPDGELNKTIKFFTGPKKMGDVRKMDFLWFTLMDMVHHRGQFSVYLRMAGGKVPSIYGPSGDEPWM